MRYCQAFRYLCSCYFCFLVCFCQKKAPLSAEEAALSPLNSFRGSSSSSSVGADALARRQALISAQQQAKTHESHKAILKQQLGFNPLTPGNSALSQKAAQVAEKPAAPLTASDYIASINASRSPQTIVTMRSAGSMRPSIEILKKFTDKYLMGEQNPGGKLPVDAHLDAVVRTTANYYYADALNAAKADKMVQELLQFPLSAAQKEMLSEAKRQGPEFWD